jgi:hypothetical protein
MSFVSEREKDLILDLTLNRISEEAFFEVLGTGSRDGRALGLAMIERALSEKDPLGVELGLYLGFRFGFSPEYQRPLLALAEAPWHKRHEDVVSGLEKLLDPASVAVLRRVADARYTYLAYDDSRALRIKSVYAISKIPTLEAVTCLAEIWHVGDDVVAPLARERLAVLEKRAASAELRSAAQKALSGGSSSA